MSSKGFVYNIINGKKNLSKSNAFRLSEALKHTRREAEYFDNLVSFNQAENLNERNLYFDRLCHTRSRGRGNPVQPVHLIKDQFEFFSKWYHAVIRSLIDMTEFSGDFLRLSKMVNPRISIRETRQSVELLEKLGLIKRGENGIWKITDKSVTTGSEVASLAVENYHMETADLAKRALGVTPADRRNVSGLVLGISENGYRRICEELREFQGRIMEIADADSEADRVYHLNFHFYPASDTCRERTDK
jgi:uncharacterized protein (TIGR02147 family)